jgi:protein gp37
VLWGVRPNPVERGAYWDATVNLVAGCEIVRGDPSCLNCYAVTYAAGVHKANDIALYRGTTEFKHGRNFWTGHLTVQVDGHPDWTDFSNRRFPKPVLGQGKPGLIWFNSMSDLFHPRRDLEPVNRILETVAVSPHHMGLVVTKHCAQCVEYFLRKPVWWRKRFILLFSAGDQRWWDVRWAIMRTVAEQGWIIGTSIAPILALVVLSDDHLRLGRWVIVSGEQPPGYRPMDPDWVRSIRDQCIPKGMPLFVKETPPGWIPLDLLFRQFPKV